MQKNRYKLPGDPDKVVFSQSWLSMYFECPMKFALAYDNEAEWGSNATRNGNLFERMVLGDFDGKMSIYSYKSGKTQPMIQKCADDFLKRCRPIKPEGVQPQIIADLGNYGLAGTLDYLGALLDDKECINDLKFSEKPTWSTFYNPLNSPEPNPDGTPSLDVIKDILQPVTYTYLAYKKHGKILPFKRIVVSPLGGKTNVWTKTFNVGTASFTWLETQLETAYKSWSMGFTPATDDHSKCWHKKNGSCKYLQFCNIGLGRIFSNDVVSVDELLGIEELMY